MGRFQQISLILIVSAVGIALAAEGIRRLRARRKHTRSLEWPSVEMIAQKGNIQEFAQAEGPNGYRLHVPYTYAVGDFQHSGRYTEECESLGLAQLARTALAERKLYVRYNPADPS